MSYKQSDRYSGTATRRKQMLTEIGNRFHSVCLDVENEADKLLKIAEEKDDSALRAIANSLLQTSLFNQGWIES